MTLKDFMCLTELEQRISLREGTLIADREEASTVFASFNWKAFTWKCGAIKQVGKKDATKPFRLLIF